MSSCPSKKIRIGVVGGGFGTAWYWHQHPDCVVAAVSDLIPERRKSLMEMYGCSKSYNSIEELIKDKDIDAVAVFTPATLHAQHTIACMRAGKHVISAVPACITIEQAEEMLETVKKTGLTYMMAETSYYRQPAISARKFYKDGLFGDIFHTEAEYHHTGVEDYWFDKDGKPEWRHGYPPMLYPTHMTSFLIGITGERLVEVSCSGWGDGDPLFNGNKFNNHFWNETAFFRTNKGNTLRASYYKRGAVSSCERAQWYGTKMSFFMDNPNTDSGIMIVRAGDQIEKDSAGFARHLSPKEHYNQPEWWKTDMLPEPLRHGGGHDGAESFITHEFIDALVHKRNPTIDIYEALAYTVPGIIAHESAISGNKILKIPSFDPNI